jgi:hypothetical protein
MENPFLIPPQVESAASRSWGQGFTWGFQGPAFSILPREDLPIEDLKAFDLGVLAGQQAAIDGLAVESSCVDLNVEHPALLAWANPSEVTESLSVMLGGAKAGIEIGKHFLGAGFSVVLFLLELAIGLETFSDDPKVELSKRAEILAQALVDLGFDAPMTCFLGGGIDLSQTGCELLLTPIFRRLEDARAAAQGLGRTGWIVVSWRNDQSGGVRMVASSVAQ